MSREPRDPIQQAYDRWSQVYDSDANATRDLDATVLRGQPLALERTDVLELGAGTGKNTIFLAQRARQVVALDFSQGMLERARARLGAAANVRFLTQDLRAPWAVPEGAFDRVVGNLVLEHIAELAPIYAQAARALRSGGMLYLCELHPFRQRAGAQARFADERVPAFLHDVSDYVAAALGADFSLSALEEWWDDPADRSSAPRLLSQRWYLER